MSAAPAQVAYAPIVLHLRPAIDMTDEQLYQFCLLNGDLRIERTADGDLLIMPPTGGRTGDRNAEITSQLRQWAKRDGHGVAFDSSTGFRLPNGAMRAPDAAWVRRSRLDALREEDRDRFLPLCPDFVIELRSPSEDLLPVREKMEEYRANGTRLGWLIDPIGHRVHVYGPSGPSEELRNPRQLSGDPVLPGFTLDLTGIWTPSL